MQPIVEGNSPWDLGFQHSIPAAPHTPEIPWKSEGKATSWQVCLWNVNFLGQVSARAAELQRQKCWQRVARAQSPPSTSQIVSDKAGSAVWRHILVSPKAHVQVLSGRQRETSAAFFFFFGVSLLSLHFLVPVAKGEIEGTDTTGFALKGKQ